MKSSAFDVFVQNEVKFMFSKKTTKISIWHYVASVKSTVKISSILVAFLENMNFKRSWKFFLFW